MLRIETEAAAWIAGGDHTARDTWRAADPRHDAVYRKLKARWDDIATLRGAPEIAAWLETPTWRERLVAAFQFSPWRIALPIVAAAAMAALVVVPSLTGPGFETAVGEVRDIALDDGSTVTLGGGSRIAVDFTKDGRRVELVRGEAFFSVAKDPARPFVVAAGDTTARAVGTQFNVHRGAQDVRVAVLEGVVEVTAPAVTAQTLSAGQEAIAPRVARPTPAPVKVAAVARPGAWRSGRFYYDGAPLRDVLADVNRYYKAGIALGSADLGELQVTTSFDATQIDQMVKTLTRALPVTAERAANGRITLRAAPPSEN